MRGLRGGLAIFTCKLSKSYPPCLEWEKAPGYVERPWKSHGNTAWCRAEQIPCRRRSPVKPLARLDEQTWRMSSGDSYDHGMRGRLAHRAIIDRELLDGRAAWELRVAAQRTNGARRSADL